MPATESVIDTLEMCVDDLLGHNLSGRSFRELATHLQRLEVLRHRLEAASTFAVAALHTAWQTEPAATELPTTANKSAPGDTDELVGTDDLVIAQAHAATVALTHLLHLDPPAAKARLRQAEALGSRQAVTGDTLPPVFPVAADALATGGISPDHARLIIRTVHTLPLSLALLHASSIETDLVSLSRELTVREVATCAQRILDALDPDGAQPVHEQQQRDRHLSLHTRRDGSADLRATLTPEAVAVWDAIFDSLAQPATTSTSDETATVVERDDRLPRPTSSRRIPRRWTPFAS